MPTLRTLHRLVLAAACALASFAARADLYVVVNAANPVKVLTQREVVDIYMGRTRAFPNGDYALPFDLPRENASRGDFYKALTGMSPAEVNSYWARLVFTGQTMPPQPLPNEAAVLDVVRRNPGALGYLPKEPQADKALRVVLVLKEAR